jgi:transposase
LIADDLPPRISGETQTALLAWPEGHLLSLTKYACWLNLIEPWWKQLRSLGLKRRRFMCGDEIIEAIIQAAMYRNTRRCPYVWRKAA